MPVSPIQLTDCISPAVLHRLLESFAAATGRDVMACDPQWNVIAVSHEKRAATAEAPSSGVAIDVEGRTIAMLSLCGPAQPEGNGQRQADIEHLLEALAELITQLCDKSDRLRDRTEQMTALAHLSTLLSGRRELSLVLKTVAQSVTELMEVKAAAIRLIDGGEMRVVAGYNLSPKYLDKGPILLDRSDIDQAAINGEVIYVEDMAGDPRTLYPEDARREGLASLLCAGMVYRGKPVGVIRVYTAAPRKFTTAEVNLLRGVAQLSAGAIRTAQLDSERHEQMRMQRQVELAADVQKQLLPAKAPDVPPFEVAGRYEPCFELGGDFFDYIPFTHGLGVVVGDVVGKGVAASLLMATVRASLRAHAEDVYEMEAVMRKVNTSLTRDTRENEFATVFYGTFDTRTRRLTYCCAGHEPALLLRGGQFTDLDIGGLPLGIEENFVFNKGWLDLRPGDVLLIYTDGVSDASNFQSQRFGRQRIREAVVESSQGSAQDIVNHVLWQTRRYVGLNKRPDDMTIVAVKVR